MTRKHFQAIASTFKQQMDNPTVPAESRVTLFCLASTQADYFATVNPLFDRQKFLTACGFPAKVGA